MVIASIHNKNSLSLCIYYKHVDLILCAIQRLQTVAINYTGSQNKQNLSVLDVRHIFSNLVFTAEHEYKVKILAQMAKNWKKK